MIITNACIWFSLNYFIKLISFATLSTCSIPCKYLARTTSVTFISIREHPFNVKGGGGMVFVWVNFVFAPQRIRIYFSRKFVETLFIFYDNKFFKGIKWFQNKIFHQICWQKNDFPKKSIAPPFQVKGMFP